MYGIGFEFPATPLCLPKIARMTNLGEEPCRGGQKVGKKGRRYIWAAPYPETTVFLHCSNFLFR